MTEALHATNGHYSQFTGDGLMAIYGLNTTVPADGATDAVRGACEMLGRLDQLNRRLKGICRSRCGWVSASIAAMRSWAPWDHRGRRSSPRLGIQ